MKKENSTLILDIKTWRCGSNGRNKLGLGGTQLLNREGYSCCLGQFALQNSINPSCIEGKTEPKYIDRCMISSPLYKRLFIDECEEHPKYKDNSDLANRLMKINDSRVTSPQVKIERIQKELAEHDVTLKLINAPEEWNLI